MLDEGEVRAFIFSTCCGSKTQICGKLYKDGASDIFAIKIFLWILYTYDTLSDQSNFHVHIFNIPYFCNGQ